MKLLIGLGNPGKKYEKTRHNAGFITVNKIASALQTTPYKLRSIFNAEISEGTVNDEKVILAKPQTFMNESGKAVKAIADYYKIDIKDIIIIHDDLDISLGEYRIAKGRSSAGHKGVQSIIDALGTKDFMRIRIGIKPLDSSPKKDESLDSLRSLGTKQTPVQEFVLENFGKEEQKIINEVIEKVCGEIEKV